jgi:predicted NBD/HSP70 family sugar kinase
MEKKYNWGIDLGGTKIECVILDQHDPTQVILRERIDTESIKGYDHIIAQVGRLIDSVSQKVGFRPTRLGFATPGVLDPASQTMKN